VPHAEHGRPNSHWLPNSCVFAPEGLGSYLLQDVGLADATPRDFINNVANGVELSVRQMNFAKEWLASGRVKVFAANVQVSTPQILELQKYAAAHGVAVIKFSETELVPSAVVKDSWRYDYPMAINYYLDQLAALAAK